MQDEGSFRYFHHNYHLGESLGFKITIVYQIADAYKYIYYMLHAKRETRIIRALSSNKAMKKMKLRRKKIGKHFQYSEEKSDVCVQNSNFPILRS